MKESGSISWVTGSRRCAALILLLCAHVAVAAEWRVQPGGSIAAAIRSAKSGDTVLVERGYYTENLEIDKPLTLKGLNRPTISGGGRDNVISVVAPDVVIEGLIVRDSGSDLQAQNAGIYDYPGAHRLIVRNNDITYNLFGLYIEGVKDPQAIGNVITGKRDYMSAKRGNGIQLFNTTGAKIVGNNISFARDGIYVESSHHAEFRDNKIHHLRYGTHYMNSYHNLWEGNESYLNRGGLALMMVHDQTVRNNRAWGNTDHGIMLRTIQDSVIENNVVAGNYRGFFIYDAEYNVIRDNLVIGNSVGVHLWAGSYRNEVNGNDFIGNESQVKYVATRDELWGKERGNYWSNYVGWDRDGDGAGDVAYAANDAVDRLTWKYPMVKMLLNSPAIQTLRFVARQFPLLRAPSIVDERPRMQPNNKEWSQWYDKMRH